MSRRWSYASYALWGTGLLWLAWSSAPEAISTLRLATLGLVPFPTRVTIGLCGLLVLGSSVVYAWRYDTKRLGALVLSLDVLLTVLAILIWASSGRRLEVLGLLAQTLRLATPIALGAFGGLLCERSGIINIAIEGMMLSAACCGFLVALWTQSVWLGVLAASASGGCLAALHALLTLYGGVEQIMSGIVLNMLAIGGTGFLRRTVLLHHAQQAPGVLPAWPVPFLADIPVLGGILFHHQPLVYAMGLLALLLHLLLGYSRWGLRTRALGDNPQAADTAGIAVIRVRGMNVILGGMVAGLGGAWFSLETVGNFEDAMTGGKGFIALAALIFGNWTAGGALAGALLFGAADALQIKLQIAGVQVPYQMLGMIPYLVTMIVLAGVMRQTRPPAALGLPYRRRA